MTETHPTVPHPLVDIAGETWTATETRARAVRLTPARIDLLRRCREAERTPVLISDELSRLTPALASVWRDAGGRWVVREPDGSLRDGFTGRRASSIDEAVTAPAVTDPDAVSRRALAVARPDQVVVRIEAAVRHRARSTTVLGRLAEDAARAVIGESPGSFGAAEPAATRWDRRELTAFARSTMPDDAFLVVAGRAMTGTITARRTRHGIEELTSLHLGTGTPSTIDYARRRDALAAALTDIAATEQPLSIMTFAALGDASLTVAPAVPLLPTPELLLIGAPAVRSMRIDVEGHVTRHGARVVGRPRTPALLYQLGSLGDRTWERLDALLADIDRDALSAALGTTGSAVVEGHRPSERTADGQP